MFSQKSLVNWIWNVIILSVTIVRKLELKEYIDNSTDKKNSEIRNYIVITSTNGLLNQLVIFLR